MKSIQTQWLSLLKQWIQQPIIDGLLTDDMILKHGENIVDSERSLAALIQSANIRLPGQRFVQFISMEALKDIQLLKQLLSFRINDYLHCIFLIPPESLSLFDWCNADYFSPLTPEEGKDMANNILSECNYDNKGPLLNVLQEIFESVQYSKQFDGYFTNFYSASNLWFKLCQKTVEKYNNKTNLLNEKLHILKTAIKTLSRIRQLSIIGNASTLEQLIHDLDDADLTLLMQKRRLTEDTSSIEDINTKIDKTELEYNLIEEEILQKQAKIDVVITVRLFIFKLNDCESLGSRKRFSSRDRGIIRIYTKSI